MSRLIDRFMPLADVSERHETLVQAPADVVFDVAQHFDLQSIPIIRAIFWLRAKILGAARARDRPGRAGALPALLAHLRGWDCADPLAAVAGGASGFGASGADRFRRIVQARQRTS